MITSQWVLTLLLAMLAHEPGPLPWLDYLPAEAEAIAEEDSARPLPGMTPGLTAALDVVMAWREARFNPHALHDHGAGYGLFGTHEATLGRPIPLDVAGQLVAWHSLARVSFRICLGEGRDRSEVLGWYAAGGERCERRLALSRSRVWEAQRLLRDHPPK
jgi:hypothetical protein